MLYSVEVGHTGGVTAVAVMEVAENVFLRLALFLAFRAGSSTPSVLVGKVVRATQRDSRMKSEG